MAAVVQTARTTVTTRHGDLGKTRWPSAQPTSDSGLSRLRRSSPVTARSSRKSSLLSRSSWIKTWRSRMASLGEGEHSQLASWFSPIGKRAVESSSKSPPIRREPLLFERHPSENQPGDHYSDLGVSGKDVLMLLSRNGCDKSFEPR